jgi:hypothetical protein
MIHRVTTAILSGLFSLRALAATEDAAPQNPALGHWQGMRNGQQITMYLCQHGKCFTMEGKKEGVGKWSQEGTILSLSFDRKTLHAGLLSRTELLVTEDDPRRAVLLQKTAEELSPALHYRHCQDGESLYAIFRGLRPGDTMAKVTGLLGPGTEPQDRARHLAATRRIATKVPEGYPAGVEDTDVFLGYAYEEGMTMYLQFRDGKLVNHRPEACREVQKYDVMGP